MNKRLIVILMSLLVILSLAFTGCGKQEDKKNNNTSSGNTTQEKKIEAKFASEEIEGDFMTVWAQKFAEEMKKSSNGNIDITVYPFGTLGESRDINELCQLGVVQFVFSDFAWISSFVPEAQVLALNYIWPKERIIECLEWVVKNGEFMPVLEKYFRQKGLVPLGVMFEGWQTITSKKPINSLADMNGFKVRVMGSKLLVENYKAYGAVPTPITFGEVYTALQTGLVEGQINPIFAIRSSKFYEVQDYFIQAYNEPFLGIPTVNAQFFDSLPKETQEKMRQWWKDAVVPAGEWIDAKHKEDLAAMLKEKPHIKVIEISDEEIGKFREKAETVYPKFLEVGGQGAQEVLNVLQKDIENAKKALGIKM
ncbi:Ectoine/5-hydroxyectoine-binding periplasmic protein UehA [Moorella humiferrea]|uniref:TRAP transporter substrate-binding protein DctP n=1 Tax=Neomoorella humiferrea TaxID=676965 RepID=UPI0030D1EB55